MNHPAPSLEHHLHQGVDHFHELLFGLAGARRRRPGGGGLAGRSGTPRRAYASTARATLRRRSRLQSGSAMVVVVVVVVGAGDVAADALGEGAELSAKLPPEELLISRRVTENEKALLASICCGALALNETHLSSEK